MDFREIPLCKYAVLGRHCLARGYFCVTADQHTKEMIRKYRGHHFERTSSGGHLNIRVKTG